MLKLFTFIAFLPLFLLASDSLSCKLIQEDDIKKIKCKYKTVSKTYDRNISIAWTSPTAPQDDRFKVITLPAYNISVFDFRYYDGRAEGTWNVSATDDETGQVTTTEFIKENLTLEAEAIKPCKE